MWYTNMYSNIIAYQKYYLYTQTSHLGPYFHCICAFVLLKNYLVDFCVKSLILLSLLERSNT